MPPRKQFTDADWEQHRAELAKLYMELNMSLDKIKTYMGEHHNFFPRYSLFIPIYFQLVAPEVGLTFYVAKASTKRPSRNGIYAKT
jgi:hypothetical protein